MWQKVIDRDATVDPEFSCRGAKSIKTRTAMIFQLSYTRQQGKARQGTHDRLDENSARKEDRPRRDHVAELCTR